MRLRSAIKVVRNISGYRKYSGKQPGYRWSTATTALGIWGRMLFRKRERTLKI